METKTKATHTPGSLIVGIDCSCYTEGYAHQSITLCPLHEAAPELLEASNRLLEKIGYVTGIESERKALLVAISKAEGGK